MTSSRAQSQDHGTWNARRGAVLCCTANETAEHARQEKQDPNRGARERQRRPKHKPVGGKMNCEMHEALKAPEHNQRLIKRPSQGRVASEAEAAWLERMSACRRTVKVSS